MKQYKYRINGNLYNVTVNDIDETNVVTVEVNGAPYSVELDRPVNKPVQNPVARSISNSVETPKVAVAPKAATKSQSAIKSPLPGVILDIKVKEGDVIKRGQTILILEAMKMENNIHSDKDGKVSAIKVNKGDSVLEGADLIVIE
ncbi:MAG: biotin/lipoyl-binding protein [Bacteroidales bacterium]|jgi:glutaconyl-CoA/methylmalonyl-CoA decarboxylase subunit gamma|nr:biotin/lipoyl-binding protein [Bacteroidales bacterium]